MKQRAKELDLQKRAQRAGGSKYGPSTGISSSMYSSSPADSKPDITPTPVTYSSSSTTYVLRERERRKRRSDGYFRFDQYVDQRSVQVRLAKR